MNKLLPLFLGASAIFAHSALAQTATTTPVGVVTVQLDANRRTALSIPLENAPAAFGIVTGVTSTTITDTAASFGNLVGSSYIKITSGQATGRIFSITSNTATVLTVRTGAANFALPADNSSGNTNNVAIGDKYEIVPMFTLADIFGSNSTNAVVKYGANPNSADQVTIYSDGTSAVYFNNGSNWRNALVSGDQTNYNALGILPTSGIWIVRRATGTNASLDFVGQVPTYGFKTQLPGGARVAVGMPYPGNATLGTMGFSSTPGWVKGSNPNNADQVTIYRPDNTTSVYFLTASNVWRNALVSGDTTNYTTTVIPPGSGIWVVRRGSATGVSSTVAATLPYNLALP
jgi:hypothetical protein